MLDATKSAFTSVFLTTYVLVLYCAISHAYSIAFRRLQRHICVRHICDFVFPKAASLSSFSGRHNANKYHFTLTKFVGKARRLQYSFWKALRQPFLKLCSAGKEKRRHIRTFISGLSVVPRCVQKSEEKFYVPIICAQPLKVISGWIFWRES